MDIRDKVLETVDRNDPRFTKILHDALQDEAARLEKVSKEKKVMIQEKKEELSNSIQERKKLKANIKQVSTLLKQMKQAFSNQQEYSILLQKELILKQNMKDDASLRKLAEIKEEEELLYTLREKWKETQAKLEQLPWVKENKKAKNELIKAEVELLTLEADLKDCERNTREYEKIKKKIEQQEIIDFARNWIKSRDFTEELKELKEKKDLLVAKLARLSEERQIRLKKEEAVKQKATARSLMPPPDVIMMSEKSIKSRSFFEYPHVSIPRSSTRMQNLQKRLCLDLSDDSESISSAIFEELGLNVDNSDQTNVQEIQETPKATNPSVVFLEENSRIITDVNAQNVEENSRRETRISENKENHTDLQLEERQETELLRREFEGRIETNPIYSPVLNSSMRNSSLRHNSITTSTVDFNYDSFNIDERAMDIDQNSILSMQNSDAFSVQETINSVADESVKEIDEVVMTDADKSNQGKTFRIYKPKNDQTRKIQYFSGFLKD